MTRTGHDSPVRLLGSLALLRLVLSERCLAYSSGGSPLLKTPPSATFVNRNRKGVKYDLGVGKNSPVFEARGIDQGSMWQQASHDDTYEYAKYWGGFESVHEYPNPTKRLRTMDSPTTASDDKGVAPQSSGMAPKSIQSQLADQGFTIKPRSNSNESPVLSFQGASNNFDVNTAWVEMMIHEQAQK